MLFEWLKGKKFLLLLCIILSCILWYFVILMINVKISVCVSIIVFYDFFSEYERKFKIFLYEIGYFILKVCYVYGVFLRKVVVGDFLGIKIYVFC